MYYKSDLINDIKQLGIKPADTLLVHSSMKAVGQVYGGADTVIDSFIECLKQGLLIFPTLSHKSVSLSAPLFDPAVTPSDVGILTNIFLRRPGVVRSLHPTHSVAALGSQAAAFVAGEEDSFTPCPQSGCWSKLYDYKAKILFLGCSLTRNTFLHAVEEWQQIPCRLTNTDDLLKVKMPDGTLADRPMKRHNAQVRSWDYYDKIEQPMLTSQIAVEGKIGDARAVLCDARKMADMVIALLQKNPDYFSSKS